MRLFPALLASVTLCSPAFGLQPDAAISAFNDWCFRAGQTDSEIRANMARDAGTPLPYDLVFWDVSLEPEARDLPKGVERRCEVSFQGDHVDEATEALRKQMATPPVFGTEIPLPETHSPQPGTALIEGRELLRGRVAVVHLGLRDNRTFIAVDRLFDGLGLPRKGD